MFKKIIPFIKKRKKTSILIALIVFGGIGYYIYSSSTSGATVTKYVLASAAKNTVISTVSGSGQISASNSVDITAKASGEALSVKVKEGDAVKKGQVLVQLDASDAYKTVRDAEISLKSAQLSLEKSERGTLPKDMVSTELSLSEAKTSLEKAKTDAESDLADKYTETKTAILDAYNKYDDTMNRQLQGIYTDNTVVAKLNIVSLDSSAENNASSLRLDAIDALAKFKAVVNNYPTDTAAIDKALDNCLKYEYILQQYLYSLNDLMSAAIPAGSITQTNINSYKSSVLSLSSTVNSTVDTLTAKKKAIATQIATNAANIVSAENALARAQNSYDILAAGTDELDLASLRLSVQQKVNALADAKSAYSDYTISAPFDGQVASVSVAAGDDVSSGSAIATVITPNKVAEITFSESDIAKVKVGQKASLLFDAIEDLEITGQVAKVDLVGTVSSGVVSYAVTVSLDTNDDRIKSGMTVEATIITETKIDVLTVPNAAVKTKNGVSYVLTLPTATATDVENTSGVQSETAPTQTTVTVGLSDDTNTEILTGLSENDIVVTKTTTVTAASDSTAAPSLLQSLMPGSNRSNSTTKSSSSSSSGSTKSTTGSASSGAMPTGGDMGAPPGM